VMPESEFSRDFASVVVNDVSLGLVSNCSTCLERSEPSLSVSDGSCSV